MRDGAGARIVLANLGKGNGGRGFGAFGKTWKLCARRLRGFRPSSVDALHGRGRSVLAWLGLAARLGLMGRVEKVNVAYLVKFATPSLYARVGRVCGVTPPYQAQIFISKKPSSYIAYVGKIFYLKALTIAEVCAIMAL